MSMADEDYNRGPVGGTNWWDSSRTPAFESMELGLSSQSEPPLHQWNHPLIMGDKAGAEMGGGEGGFRSMLQQGKEPEFKPIKPGFSLDQQFLDTSSSSSSVYGNFQALMGTSPSPHQQGEGSYGYHHHPDYDGLGLMSGGAGWSSSTNKVVDHHQVLKPNPIISNPGGGGGGSFWNTSATPSSFFPLPSPLIQQHQIDIPCFDQKPQHNVMEVRDTSGPVRKTSGSSSEQTTTTSTGGTTNKRLRNEASTTTLPPFKVRKEKMGDRITALQQLVSPFGKTDTASVLSEAIEYIKFLHEQVNVLSTPYLKSGASLQHQQTSDKSKDPEGPMQDLRSRGLCLVPVSSTFPVSHETTVDFWTPTFGGTFR